MTIRFATIEDIPALVEVGQKFHELTRFKTMEYNATRVAQQVSAVIHVGQQGRGSHCFFVAENKEGAIVGVLLGCLEQHFFSDSLIASLIHYDVLPGWRMSGAALRLMSAFRTWAENRGAVELSAGVNSGTHIDKTDRFLRRMGFAQTGGNYALALNLLKKEGNLT